MGISQSSEEKRGKRQTDRETKMRRGLWCHDVEAPQPSEQRSQSMMPQRRTWRLISNTQRSAAKSHAIKRESTSQCPNLTSEVEAIRRKEVAALRIRQYADAFDAVLSTGAPVLALAAAFAVWSATTAEDVSGSTVFATFRPFLSRLPD